MPPETNDPESTGVRSVPRNDSNPFPATAVARLSQPADEFWSIETEALHQVRALLRDYLDTTTTALEGRKDAGVTKGLVLAIVGDYGTGKTHIAQEMLRQIYDRNDRRLHPLYLDAPSDTFIALYRQRFIEKLSKFEVLQRVEDLYADIVANELARSTLTAPVAEKLRRRDAEAEDVVRTLRLMESKLVRELGVKLKRVTERADFGTALLLLRRPEFQSAVWEWFSGEPPDPILQERGITLHINTDAAALEAIGVMAFLFGRQGHRFILFIDELEKVFSTAASRRPDEAAILAFKKLMEVVGKTGALLVLIGLPECLEVLPEDALQRIAAVVHPSPITAEEIERYIGEAQRRGLGQDTLEPFTRDTVEYLSEIAGGNARRVVRLCYHAYLAAQMAGTHLTRPMLRQIAREQFELSPAADVVTEITRVIEARGWLFERDKAFKLKAKTIVDFWLPLGDASIGTAIFLSPSILQEADVSALVERNESLHRKSAHIVAVETVLVVNGYLADNLRPSLESAFTKVISYRPRDFREDLDAALTGSRVRLQEHNRQSVTQLIRERVDEIARQNSTFDSRLSMLLESQVSSSDMQRAVSIGLRAVFGQLATSVSVVEAQFPSVTAVFDRSETIIREVLQPDFLFDAIFGLPRGLVAPNAERLLGQRHRLEQIASVLLENSMIAPVYVIKGAHTSFRRSIFTFLETYPQWWGATSRGEYMSREIVEYACRAFDSITSQFDLQKCVADLRRTAQRALRGTPLGDDVQLHLWDLDDPRIARGEETLRELGHDVFRAVNAVLDQRERSSVE